MIKILLLSDTHSFLDNRLIKHIKNVDEVWHAGDIGDLSVCDEIRNYCSSLRAVYGNIDNQSIRQEHSKDLHFKLQGVNFWITHIGGYPPKYSKEIKLELVKHQTNVFICGHSHILKVIYDKEIDCLHLNPGAAGKHGFHQIQTALLFDLENGELKNLRIVELEKNTK